MWDGDFVSRVKWLSGLGGKRGRPAWPSQGGRDGGGAGGKLSLTGRALGNVRCEAWRRGLLSPPSAVPVGVSRGCQTKVAQTGWSLKMRLNLTVLEAKSVKSRCSFSWLLVVSSSLVVRGLEATSLQSLLSSHGRLVFVCQMVFFVLCVSASASLFLI